MARIKQSATKHPRYKGHAIRARKTIKFPGRYSEKKLAIKSANHTIHALESKKTSDHLPKIKKKTLKHCFGKTKASRYTMKSLPKRPFQRLVREIATSFIPDCKMQSEALYALQVAAEEFLVGYFEDALYCQLHAKRKTMIKKDLELVRKLRKIEYFVPI